MQSALFVQVQEQLGDTVRQRYSFSDAFSFDNPFFDRPANGVRLNYGRMHIEWLRSVPAWSAHDFNDMGAALEQTV
jgi:hypothetical protein